VNYTVTISRSATREFERLPKGIARRVASKMKELEQEPRPPGSVKLADTKDTWRVRVGDYRVVYSVDDKQRIVDVSRIRHRRDVYD
jgi:mRNA interferase RelE/StbE